KPGTFAYRNIQQTPDDFAHLKGNELQFDVSKGVTMATQFMATDVIAVLMIFVVIVLLITREKEQRCLGLIKTTYKGRGPLVASKLLAVVIACVLIVIALYTVNFTLAGYTYGFGDVGRWIQSVDGYIGS